MCVNALSSLEGTHRFVHPAVVATHSSVAPPMAVQDTASWPNVLCDQKGLQKQKNVQI